MQYVIKIKTYTIIILAALSLSCSAQQQIHKIADPNRLIPPQQGDYVKDVNNELNKFEGIWVWQEGNKRFEMHLEKLEMFELDGVYGDGIIGRFKYEVNGIVKEDNLNQSFNSWYEYPVGGSYSDSHAISIFMFDNTRMKGVGLFTIDDTISPPELIYNISPRPYRGVYSSQQEYNTRPTEHLFPVKGQIIRLIKQ